MKCSLGMFVRVLSPCVTGLPGYVADPLPSWNDAAPKKAVIAFVEKVTKEGSTDFVPVAERISVFDNDGTLWPENPLPFQAAFMSYEIARELPEQ